MDEKEQDELLYRVDERTARLEEELLRRLEEVEEESTENRGRINVLEKNTTENGRDIRNAKAILGVLSASILALGTKVLGFLGF